MRLQHRRLQHKKLTEFKCRILKRKVSFIFKNGSYTVKNLRYKTVSQNLQYKMVPLRYYETEDWPSSFFRKNLFWPAEYIRVEKIELQHRILRFIKKVPTYDGKISYLFVTIMSNLNYNEMKLKKNESLDFIRYLENGSLKNGSTVIYKYSGNNELRGYKDFLKSGYKNVKYNFSGKFCTKLHLIIVLEKENYDEKFKIAYKTFRFLQNLID